jgi:hypothetical protein
MDPAYLITAALDGKPFEHPCDDTSEACNAADWLESAGAKGITVTTPVARDSRPERTLDGR